MVRLFLMLRGLALHCLDLGIHSTFMTGRLVFTDQSILRRTVEDRTCDLVCLFGGLFVVAGDCVNDRFKIGAHHRTTAGVLLTTAFCLSGAFFS